MRGVSVSVYCLDYMMTFKSAVESAKALDVDVSNVIKCCKGKLHRVGRYKFEYDEEINYTCQWRTLQYIGILFNDYVINDRGVIRELGSKKILSQSTDDRGRLKVYIKVDGAPKVCYVHRAIAESFIPNPQNYKYVLFKDTDKSNVNKDNLYWSN